MRYVLCFCLLAAASVEGATFVAASIKAAQPDPYGSSGEDSRNGTLKVYNVTLKRCIRYAYGVAETQIFGGPKWVDDTRYDILAKADYAASENEMLKMLQPLLAERFKLALHHEMRPVPAYALVVAKGGIKAKVSELKGRSGMNGGRGSLDGVGAPMPSLAIRLSGILGRPVVDMTGESRTFDFHLRWRPDDEDSDAPSIFTAIQEQMGLKLVAEKDSVETLVVESVERPTEN